MRQSYCTVKLLTRRPKDTVQKCSFLNSRTPSMVSACLRHRSSCGTTCAGVVWSRMRPVYTVSGCIVPTRTTHSPSVTMLSAEWVSLEVSMLKMSWWCSLTVYLIRKRFSATPKGASQYLDLATPTPIVEKIFSLTELKLKDVEGYYRLHEVHALGGHVTFGQDASFSTCPLCTFSFRDWHNHRPITDGLHGHECKLTMTLRPLQQWLEGRGDII